MIIIILYILTVILVYSFIGLCTYSLYERKYFVIYGARFGYYQPENVPKDFPIEKWEAKGRNERHKMLTLSIFWIVIPILFLIKKTIHITFFLIKKLRDKIFHFELSGATDDDAGPGSPYR